MTTPAYRSLLIYVKPLFDLGAIWATPRATSLIEARRVGITKLLVRHVSGDWGDVPSLIASANRLALQRGGELISIYNLTPTSEVNPAEKSKIIERICVVTDGDRSMTTFMMHDEY